MFWVKKDSQKQMPKIDFSKKGENTYFISKLIIDYKTVIFLIDDPFGRL